MKTIKIISEDLEYRFTHEQQDKYQVYELYIEDKLLHRALDYGNYFILDGKKTDYDVACDLFIFLKCIKETDKDLLGSFKAVTETELFKI